MPRRVPLSPDHGRCVCGSHRFNPKGADKPSGGGGSSATSSPAHKIFTGNALLRSFRVPVESMAPGLGGSGTWLRELRGSDLLWAREGAVGLHSFDDLGKDEMADDKIDPELLKVITGFRDELLKVWGDRFDLEATGENHQHLVCFMSIIGKTYTEIGSLWETVSEMHPEVATEVVARMLVHELSNIQMHERRN